MRPLRSHPMTTLTAEQPVLTGRGFHALYAYVGVASAEHLRTVRVLHPGVDWCVMGAGTVPLLDARSNVVGEVLHLRRNGQALIAHGCVDDPGAIAAIRDGQALPEMDLADPVSTTIGATVTFTGGRLAALILGRRPVWRNVWIRLPPQQPR
jgi:hypothetical protein